MKPFVGIDITENKKNEKINGEEFIVDSVSQIQKNNFDDAQQDALELVEESKLPLVLRIIQGACGLVGLMLLSGVLRAFTDEDSVSFAEGYQNAPWLFWLCGVCLAVWGILKALSVKKEKETIYAEKGENVAGKLESISKNIYAELGVPPHAEMVDILSFAYKMKDGEPKAKEMGLSTTPYINTEVKAFVEEDKLILVDLEHKYAFPLNSLQAIRTVKKSIMVPFWNKEEAPKEEKYKEYKLRVDDHGCVYLKPYHILEILKDNELWGIYFPCYEIKVFESLTGIKAE